MKIFLATKNIGKISEFQKLVLEKNIEVLSILDYKDIPEVEETGTTFKENSQKKALEIAKYLDMYTISDDSGLCVDYLHGAPGIYSARYSGEDATDEKNIEKLLSVMEGIDNRNAKFISVVSIAKPNGEVYSYEGESSGVLLLEKSGTNGFGYDPIFYSNDLKKSFGEANSDEKKSVSHRARAFNKLMNDFDKIVK